jgi:hypothetical protein
MFTFRSKAAFIQFGTTVFGLPSTAGLLWAAGDFGGAVWWAFLIFLSFVASWVWAQGMWALLKDDLQVDSPPDDC